MMEMITDDVVVLRVAYARRLQLQGHRCTGLRVWSIFNQCGLMTCTNLIRWTFVYFASWVFIRVWKEKEDRILFAFSASRTDYIRKAKMFQSGTADGRVPKFFGGLSQTGLTCLHRELFEKRRQNLEDDQKNPTVCHNQGQSSCYCQFSLVTAAC